jgi:hypothetical protein
MLFCLLVKAPRQRYMTLSPKNMKTKKRRKNEKAKQDERDPKDLERSVSSTGCFLLN